MKKAYLIIFTITMSLMSFGDLWETQEEFAKVAEKVKPAVVNIRTTKTIKQQYYDPFEEFFNNRRTPKSYEREATSLGSGFLISEDGYLLTNDHVISGADKIEVKFSDGSEYDASVVGTDSDTDVAVLKIDSDKNDFKYLKFGDSDELKVGHWGIAFGNPYGLTSTVTVGIISAKGRSGMGIENYENFIQTDASINPGNSGGPLVNLNGEVVGMNTAILSKSGGNVGIGFAIPINMIKVIKDSLIKTGEVKRAWLGVSVQPLTRKMAEKFGLENRTTGVLVSKVLEDTPAEKYGLKKGDIILEIDGEKIDNFYKLSAVISTNLPGSKVNIKILRDGKEENVEVRLGKKDDFASGNKILGMELATLDETLNEKFGYRKDLEGVAITGIDNQSEVAQKGIQPGDIIFEVNNRRVRNIEEFREIYSSIDSGEDILLYIIGQNSSRYIILEKE
ncbi:MAG: DegQ family serine endoprotease [Fusobacteriota bacterium]